MGVNRLHPDRLPGQGAAHLDAGAEGVLMESEFEIRSAEERAAVLMERVELQEEELLAQASPPEKEASAA